MAAFEALTAEQRSTLQVDLGFLPEPLPLASFAGMRLNEAAQHSWDVAGRVRHAAAIPATPRPCWSSTTPAGLGFLLGFIGKADALAEPAVVDTRGLAATASRSPTRSRCAPPTPADPTATFIGPLEAVVAPGRRPAHPA